MRSAAAAPGFAALMMVLGGALSAPKAAEPDRTLGFYERSPGPHAAFDRQRMAWTFGNARIEGVLEFSGGGFRIASLRDKKTRLEFAAAPSSAGRFFIAKDIRKTVFSRSCDLPRNGESYGATDFMYPVHSTARFLRLFFEDGAQEFTTQLARVEVISGGRNIAPGNVAKASQELRPETSAKAAIAPPDSASASSSYPGWSSKDEQPAWWQIDLGEARDIEEIRIRFQARDGKFTGVPRTLTLQASEAPNPERCIDLARDFVFESWHFRDAPEIRGGGAKTLEVVARGAGPNVGIRISVCYDLYPGNEPWLTKWIKLSASGLERDASNALTEVVFDEFAPDRLHSDRMRTFTFSNLAMVPADEDGRSGYMVSSLNYSADTRASAGRLSVGYHPNYWLSPYLNATGGTTTKVFEGFWDGDSFEAGMYQYQIFLVTRHIAATPTTTKPMACVYPDASFVFEESTARAASKMGYAGLGHVVLGDWSKTAFLGGAVPRIYDLETLGGLPANLAKFGMKPYLYIGTDSFVSSTGVLPVNIEAMRAFGRLLGKIGRAAGAAAWFIEDHPGSGYMVGGAPGGAVDAMWREGARVLLEEIRKASGPRPVSLGRTWVDKVELFDIQDWSSAGDYDNYGWADDWAKVYVERVPLQPSFTFHSWHPVYIGKKFEPRPGKPPGPDDLDFTASRSANMGIMWNVASESLAAATEEEIGVQNRWTSWHRDNAVWLEYTQTLETEGKLPDAVLGIMHLRNLHKGKYGFIGWWNHSPDAVRISPIIDLKKWMLNIDPTTLIVRSLRTGRPVPFAEKNGAIVLAAAATPLWSYDLLELTAK